MKLRVAAIDPAETLRLNRDASEKAKGQHPLEMSPSAFRFFEDLVRFPGHIVYHPERFGPTDFRLRFLAIPTSRLC